MDLRWFFLSFLAIRSCSGATGIRRIPCPADDPAHAAGIVAQQPVGIERKRFAVAIQRPTRLLLPARPPYRKHREPTGSPPSSHSPLRRVIFGLLMNTSSLLLSSADVGNEQLLAAHPPGLPPDRPQAPRTSSGHIVDQTLQFRPEIIDRFGYRMQAFMGKKCRGGSGLPSLLAT